MGHKPQPGPRVRIRGLFDGIILPSHEGRILDPTKDGEVVTVRLDQPAQIYSYASGGYCSVESLAVSRRNLEYI